MSQGSIEQQYHQQLDALMMMIEDCIDELPQDDLDKSGFGQEDPSANKQKGEDVMDSILGMFK